MIDYRSDTLTRPTQAMREAMFRAEVGDDVYGEDPTVNRLEALAAARLGKAASCFMPSGTMANLTAILTHCRRGTEVLLGDESDLYHYEAGGPSVVGGVVLHPVATQMDGRLLIAELELALRDPRDFQCAPAGLICIENPHNRRGGRVLPVSYLRELRTFADAHALPVHMDGARIFSASVTLGVAVDELASTVDSVQFCLSKNLGAPVGSMIVGSSAFVESCRRYRKLLGGGMRQSGLLAAAGIVAIEQGVGRLGEDHLRAARLGERIRSLPGIRLDPEMIETNMVFFSLAEHRSTGAFLDQLERSGVRMAELGKGRIRAVVHHQISDPDIETTIKVFEQILGAPSSV